jgi:type I restriction enzyme S subunit
MSGVRTVLLKDICNFEKGSTGLMKAVPGEYPLVTTGKDNRSCESYQFDTKAVCIPLVSSTGHGHASLNNVHYQEGKFALGSILVALTAQSEEQLDVHFLHLYLSQLKDVILVPLMKGAANVSLSIAAIKNVEIPLPSITRQKEIVKKFRSIASEEKDLINELLSQKELVNKLRKQILQEAIEGKLTLEWRGGLDVKANVYNLINSIDKIKNDLVNKKIIPKQKKLELDDSKQNTFHLPDGWEWCRLCDLGYTQTGTTPATNDKDNYGNFIPFVQPADIKQNGSIDYDVKKLSNQGLNKGRFIEANSVLMVCIGGSIGKSSINMQNVSCNQQINSITPLANVEPFYLQIIFQSPYFQKKVWGKASGGATPIVNKSKWESIDVPLCSIEEQKQIVKKVKKINEIIDCLDQKITNSQYQISQLVMVVLKEEFLHQKTADQAN